MQSSYKRLGDFIKLVDERNKDLEVKNLVGLTINKIFIPYYKYLRSYSFCKTSP